MKYFDLKFNYAVEIGAHLAYKGHYQATGDMVIKRIAREELQHRAAIRRILNDFSEQPSPALNVIFYLIGKTIQRFCHISPNFLMDLVARSMEIFAVFSYSRLATKYPKYKKVLEQIVESEYEHSLYFKGIKLIKSYRLIKKIG